MDGTLGPVALFRGLGKKSKTIYRNKNSLTLPHPQEKDMQSEGEPADSHRYLMPSLRLSATGAQGLCLDGSFSSCLVCFWETVTVITPSESWRVLDGAAKILRIGESKNNTQRGLLRPSPLFSLSVSHRAAEYSHSHRAGVKMLRGGLGKSPGTGPRGDAMAENWSWRPDQVKRCSALWGAGMRGCNACGEQG